jgi:hypothetical protein
MKTKQAQEIIKGDIILAYHEMEVINISVLADCVSIVFKYLINGESHNLVTDKTYIFQVKEV